MRLRTKYNTLKWHNLHCKVLLKTVITDVTSFIHEANVELILGLQWNTYARLSAFSSAFNVFDLIGVAGQSFKNKLLVFAKYNNLCYKGTTAEKDPYCNISDDEIEYVL